MASQHINIHNSGVMSGNVTTAGDMNVMPGGALRVAKTTISGNLENGGTVQMNSEGGKPGNVLTVNGNYTGNNGLMTFNATLGGDNSPTDKMNVKGDTQGNTRVRVDNIGGVGVACFSYTSNTWPVGVEIAGARLLMNQDGTINVQSGATEIGQGADTVFSQMVAETVGVPVSDVRVISTQDTDVTPFDPGAFASRQSYVAAPALRSAALLLKEKIIAHAAVMLHQSAMNLTLIKGHIVLVERPEEPLMSLKDLAMDAFYHPERGGQLSAESSIKTTTNPPAFGCTFVDLTVDIALCKVTINRILNVHDSGHILNPLLAEGQVHGGMGMGIGWALFEEMIIDAKSGVVRNPNLLDYKMPTMPDLPQLESAFVEINEPQSAYGHKSLGEPPIIPVAAAIRNAVKMATGVAINTLPLTPKRLYEEFHLAGLI